MKIVVDGGQMKQCDKNTIEHFGVPSLVLMERAALGVVEEIERYFQEGPQKERVALGAVEEYERYFQEEPQRAKKRRLALAVCGWGNNGGDGLAIGRLLWQRGYDVTIVMPPGNGRLSEETRTQKEILNNYGITVEEAIPDKEFDVIIDALFGIGLTRNLEGV